MLYLENAEINIHFSHFPLDGV